MTSYEQTGEILMRQGPSLMKTAPSSLYPTADEHWVLIAANNDPIFRRLVRVVGHPEWATDPRYATQGSRGERVDEVDGLVAEWTSARTAEEVQPALIEAEVTVSVSRVNTIADIFEGQHYRARDMLLKVAHPLLGALTMTGVVPKLSATPGGVRKAGPGLGEETRSVLKSELGLDDAQIDEFASRGFVQRGPVAPREAGHVQ